MTASPARTFLGWDRTPTAAAADWLVERYGADMERVLVALPGARAVRTLRERLARAAPAGWIPPRITTQGELVDELVHLDRPVAGRLARTLAWARALDELSPSDLGRIVRLAGGPRGVATEERDLSERLRLADTVRALHGLLAPENLDFANLAEGKHKPESPGEAARWASLAKAQKRWRKVLAGTGLLDPHEGRLAAIEAGRVDAERDVVLVGVADMNHVLVRLLETIGDRATALVVAPEELADGFDALGRLDTEFWRARDLPLALDAWHVAEKPVDQADTVGAILAGWGGRFAAEEVTVGVADEEVVPYLERRFASAGAAARDAAGTRATRTRPFKLLVAARRFLERGTFDALAALARHPDLAPLLLERADPAAALDRYHKEHLPALADGAWVEDERRTPAVAALHARLGELLGKLAGGRPRSVAAWTAPVRAFLTAVYGRMELDPEDEGERLLSGALKLAGQALGELEEVPEALAGPSVPAVEALALLERELGSKSVPPGDPGADRPTVELLGWLELPLDDAPALVVTGFNEGRIPRSLQGDPFLPDSVRRRLGLPDDAARLARDAYAAAVLIATREAVAFVTGRRTVVGDPLVPSRLAFHAPPERVVERVRRFLPDDARPEESDAHEEGRFELPVLSSTPPVESMSVSSFGSYLASPFQFYLERAVKLRTLDDRERELVPMTFGNLAHAVLEDFGRSELKDSDDVEAIRDWLEAAVERRVRATYGAGPLPAVLLQAEQLEFRLRRFAERQAARAAEGWTIDRVEWTPEHGELVVDGVPMKLTGRVDRIDVHPEKGWAILDYKTGARAGRPEERHRARKGKGAWVDLQLPLYRHLADELRAEGGDAYAGEPQLGYAWVGKDDASIDFLIASRWTEADFAEALEVASDVVRAVRAGRFADLGRRAPREEILRAIRGQGLLEGDLQEDPA